MLGSKDKPGRTEEKIETIRDVSIKALESLKKNNLDDVKKKLNYIKTASNGLMKLGDHLRKTLSKKVDDLDQELLRYI